MLSLVFKLTNYQHCASNSPIIAINFASNTRTRQRFKNFFNLTTTKYVFT